MLYYSSFYFFWTVVHYRINIYICFHPLYSRPCQLFNVSIILQKVVATLQECHALYLACEPYDDQQKVQITIVPLLIFFEAIVGGICQAVDAVNIGV